MFDDNDVVRISCLVDTRHGLTAKVATLEAHSRKCRPDEWLTPSEHDSKKREHARTDSDEFVFAPTGKCKVRCHSDFGGKLTFLP